MNENCLKFLAGVRDVLMHIPSTDSLSRVKFFECLTTMFQTTHADNLLAIALKDIRFVSPEIARSLTEMATKLHE
jgi:hypothetical protein